MKRYLLAIILLCATPCIAGIGIGVAPWPGPGVMVGVTAPSGISDDFSSDTSANYTSISGSVSISGGTLGGGNNWAQNYAYHETSTGSNDHYVQGKIQTGGPGAGGAIGLRSNGTTGYLFYLSSTGNRLYHDPFNAGSITTGGYYDINSPPGAGSYTIKITVSGGSFHAYIDLNSNGLFNDANEDLGTWSDTTYSTGAYVLVGALRGADNVNYRVDNFSGGL